MEFHKNDAIVVSGTRYDGCFGTVIQRAATDKYYRVKVTLPNKGTKVAVLHSSSLFPALFPKQIFDPSGFLVHLEHDDTIQLALALDIPLPLTFQQQRP